MPPVNDLPITFPNSINAPGDVVRIPTDVTAQWDMCRWAKSRGGVLMADRLGPVYVAGGALSQVSYQGQGDPGDIKLTATGRIIEAAGADFRGLAPGQSLIISGAAQAGNNKSVTLATVAPKRLTTVEALVNENSSSARLYSPYLFGVSPCEGWPLEEVLQEERVALRAVAGPAIVNAAPPVGSDGPSVTLVAMSVIRDGGLVAGYPVTLPSPGRAATYMEVTNTANTVVPLWAIMADPSRGAGYNELHDLRLRPFEVVYADQNASPDLTLIIPYDAVGGWSVLRSARVWIYAPVGALFEVTGAAAHVRPWNTSLADGQERGFALTNDSDRTLERRLSLLVNGQLASNLDDSSGVEVVAGLTEASTAPNQYNPNVISPAQPMMVRTIFRSRANAIHDICLAAFVAEGQRFQYSVHIKQPQLWARMVGGQPQFPLQNASDTAAA